MKRELTAWHEKELKPAYIGVYEVRRKPNGKQLVRWFAFWSGEKWSFTATTPAGAAAVRDQISSEAERAGGFEWRGLANPPRGARAKAARKILY